MNNMYVLLGNLLGRRLNVSDNVDSALNGYNSSDGARKMWVDVLKKIATIVDQFLPVAMIVLGLVAVFYVIILGTRYARSENNDDKNKVKEKLINGVIGFVIGLVIMALMFVFLNNVPAVAKWINGTDEGGSWY